MRKKKHNILNRGAGSTHGADIDLVDNGLIVVLEQELHGLLSTETGRHIDSVHNVQVDQSIIADEGFADSAHARFAVLSQGQVSNRSMLAA